MDGGSSGGSRQGARGARPPSFLDQNETGPPLTQGLDDPTPPPLPLSEGLDLPLGRFVESTCRHFGPIMVCTWYWALPSENS